MYMYMYMYMYEQKNLVGHGSTRLHYSIENYWACAGRRQMRLAGGSLNPAFERDGNVCPKRGEPGAVGASRSRSCPLKAGGG